MLYFFSTLLQLHKAEPGYDGAAEGAQCQSETVSLAQVRGTRRTQPVLAVGDLDTGYLIETHGTRLYFLDALLMGGASRHGAAGPGSFALSVAWDAAVVIAARDSGLRRGRCLAPGEDRCMMPWHTFRPCSRYQGCCCHGRCRAVPGSFPRHTRSDSGRAPLMLAASQGCAGA